MVGKRFPEHGGRALSFIHSIVCAQRDNDGKSLPAAAALARLAGAAWAGASPAARAPYERACAAAKREYAAAKALSPAQRAQRAQRAERAERAEAEAATPETEGPPAG